MDPILGATLVISVCACFLLLKPRDYLPMLVNVVLIVAGTIAALWLYVHPEVVTSMKAWAEQDGRTLFADLLILLALQPVVFLGARWVANRLPGPKASK